MGALFFITINQCFSTVSAAELFIMERKLFMYVLWSVVNDLSCWRYHFSVSLDPDGIWFLLGFLCNRHEYISGYYRVSVYFLAKILSDITLRTITSVIFSCFVYFLIGMNSISINNTFLEYSSSRSNAEYKHTSFSVSSRNVCVYVCVHSGLKCTAAAFLVFTLTVTLVAYTATAMTMAISADQSVVALANIFMTITFVFMMVRFHQKSTYFYVVGFKISQCDTVPIIIVCECVACSV